MSIIAIFKNRALVNDMLIDKMCGRDVWKSKGKLLIIACTRKQICTEKSVAKIRQAHHNVSHGHDSWKCHVYI